jgi:hypothetical protein
MLATEQSVLDDGQEQSHNGDTIIINMCLLVQFLLCVTVLVWSLPCGGGAVMRGVAVKKEGSKFTKFSVFPVRSKAWLAERNKKQQP